LQKNSVEANVLDLEERHCLFNLAIGSRNLTEEKFFKLLRLLISKGATLKKVPNTVELFDELHKNFSEAAINVSFSHFLLLILFYFHIVIYLIYL